MRGFLGSFASRATPPIGRSKISVTDTPKRCATKLWPSSCSVRHTNSAPTSSTPIGRATRAVGRGEAQRKENHRQREGNVHAHVDPGDARDAKGPPHARDDSAVRNALRASTLGTRGEPPSRAVRGRSVHAGFRDRMTGFKFEMESVEQAAVTI